MAMEMLRLLEYLIDASPDVFEEYNYFSGPWLLIDNSLLLFSIVINGRVPHYQITAAYHDLDDCLYVRRRRHLIHGRHVYYLYISVLIKGSSY